MSIFDWDSCCASSEASTPAPAAAPAPAPAVMNPTPTTTTTAAKSAPAPAPAPSPAPAPAPADQAPPPSKVYDYPDKSYLGEKKAPQPEHVSMETIKAEPPGPKTNPAYRGWAPPKKEWDKTEKKKGDQTRFEIEEKWDEEGNLHRTTVKKTITPDWKTKIERTTEIIPAAEAAKLKKK